MNKFEFYISWNCPNCGDELLELEESHTDKDCPVVPWDIGCQYASGPCPNCGCVLATGDLEVEILGSRDTRKMTALAFAMVIKELRTLQSTREMMDYENQMDCAEWYDSDEGIRLRYLEDVLHWIQPL